MINLPHLAAMRYRDYSFTWATNALGGASTWTFLIASQWFILEKSDKSAMVGLFTFASMLPFLLASPIGGLLADRIERKKLTFITIIVGLTVITITAILSITGVLELWHLSLLAFISGCCRTTQESSITALVTNVVDRKDLMNAITLNAATRHGSRAIGMAFLLLARFANADFANTSYFLILSAVFSVGAAIFILCVHKTSIGESNSTESPFNGMVEGMIYIYTNRVVAIFIILVAFHCALVMSFDSILPAFTRDILGSSNESLLALLVLSYGAGSAIGTFLMAGITSDKNKGTMLILTAIVSGLTPIALGFSNNSPLAFASCIAMGGSQAIFMSLTATYVQLVAPDRLRGRVTSLYILHAGGIMAFANLGYGFLSDQFGAPEVLITTGIIFIVIFLALRVSDPILKSVSRGETFYLQPSY